MPTHPYQPYPLAHDNSGAHTRSIHELNNYFLYEPLQHFDGRQKWVSFLGVFVCCFTFTRHLVSNNSTLDGAVTFPTVQVLK